MRPGRKFKNLLALGAIVLFISGTTTSAYSEESVDRNFTIDVNAPADLCAGHTAEFPNGDPVTWAVDTDVALTDLNTSNTGTNSITVDQYGTVDVSVDLNWDWGSQCDSGTGIISNVYPTGNVTATWSVPSFTLGFELCPSDTPCLADNTGTVSAQMTAPSNDSGPFPGSVTISWVP
jgi:hypothetical protein